MLTNRSLCAHRQSFSRVLRRGVTITAAVVVALVPSMSAEAQGTGGPGTAAQLKGPVRALTEAGITSGGVANSFTTHANSHVVSLVPVAALSGSAGQSHRGSRGRHVLEGVLIGGAAGVVVGLIGDRTGSKSSEGRTTFDHLESLTGPLGAIIGALIGAALPAD